MTNDVKIAVSDKFATKSDILSRTCGLRADLQLIQKTRAESKVGVAASSILARSLFDQGFTDEAKEYHMSFSKEAYASVVDAGREFVSRFGHDKLVDVAKLHFKTSEAIRSNSGQPTAD